MANRKAGGRRLAESLRWVYSPRLASVDELFYQRDGPDSAGYDEWYVFDKTFDHAPPDLGELIKRSENPFEPMYAPRDGRLMVFVNYMGFVIHDPGLPEQALQDMFWRQLERVKPESYIADGRDCLTFVTSNAALFDIVSERLRYSKY